MEQFVVSARKYRPASFDSVVGQEHVTSTLKNAIRSGQVAQAFLFTGPRGVGKTTCARILARTVNCEHLSEELTVCGQCPSCKSFAEGHSLNIFELDAASNNGVDHIRDLIQQVHIAPQVGTRKVYIIDEVHMLSSAAFNAFLKILEEPPSYAIFILATTEKHKILPTILSRCQVFDFRRINVHDIVGHLEQIAGKEGVEAEKQALHTIAQKADGGLRDALSIFDQLVSFSGKELTNEAVLKILNVLDHEHYFNMTEQLIHGDAPGALVAFNKVMAQGFDGHLFVTGLARHFRDLLVCQDPRTIALLEVSDAMANRYKEQAAAIPYPLLVKGLTQLGQVDVQYKSSQAPRLLVELALIELAEQASGQAPDRHTPPKEATVEKKRPDPVGQPMTTAAEPATPGNPPPAPPATKGKGIKEATMAERKAQMRRRVAGSVSINAHLAPVAQPTTETMTADPLMLPEEEDGAGAELNEALLQKEWNAYALKLKKRGRMSLHATLMANKPMITGPQRLAFTIVNAVQANYMKEEKAEIMGHLRRSLAIPGLELDVVRQEAAPPKPRYTTHDRFMIMAERNPHLLELKEALDLDLGY